MYKKLESPLIRGLCITCGKNPQMYKGNGRYRAQCGGCHKRRYNMLPSSSELDKYFKGKKYIKNKYQNYKLDICCICGFTPAHPCQLDVDHIDGNHSNNSKENLQTLCANCHRLKTFLSKEGIYRVVENTSTALLFYSQETT